MRASGSWPLTRFARFAKARCVPTPGRYRAGVTTFPVPLWHPDWTPREARCPHPVAVMRLHAIEACGRTRRPCEGAGYEGEHANEYRAEG